MMQNNQIEQYRKGFVQGLFTVFHLSDIPEQEIPMHFHDFRKIVIVLEGTLFYDVEGRRYELEPGDFVLVEAGELHRPIPQFGQDASYERVIIYFSEKFFAMHQEASLDFCFQMLRQGAPHVLHTRAMGPEFHPDAIRQMAGMFSRKPAIQLLMQECRLTELLLILNQSLEHSVSHFREPITQNQAVREVMQYVSEHLTETIDISCVADYIHLDPSYLMHLFKEETGSSIMGYLTEKRLFVAQGLMRNGVPAMTACEQSGFTNYTSFYRAYKKRYGCSPARSNEKHFLPYL